jgi:hypothetical protein
MNSENKVVGKEIKDEIVKITKITKQNRSR